MPTLCSFLQSALLFVKSFAVRAAKSDYRRKAVLVSAGIVFAVVAFTSGGFGGGGRNAMTVFAETASSVREDGADDTEEMETITEADIRIELTDQIQEGQKLAGEFLAQELREEENCRNLARGKAEDVRKRIQKEEEERKRAEEKTAGLMAEETARMEEAGQRTEEEEKRAVAKASMSADDYQVLLRIVQAEAGICDERGKILVANVVLNRVRSDRFPDTVRKVVYQRGQFSPVSNGSIDTCRVTQETIDCVERAMAGEDYSQGALFFMNRRGSSSGNTRWFDSHLTYLFSHESHEFFK